MRVRVVRKLAGLRQRDLPVWQQDGLVALFTLVLGVLVYTTGLSRMLSSGSHGLLWVRLAELVAISDLLYAATLYGSRRVSRVLIGVAALAPIALLFGLAHSSHIGVVVALGVLPISIWWGANVRHRRDAACTQRANAAQRARIGELDRSAAVAVERGRMARDLHDVIAGHLSAIAIQSGAALATQDDPGTARTVLTSVRKNSVHALREMRAMIDLLRAEAETLVDETTAPARLAELYRLVASARAGGMQVTVESTVDGVELPVAIDLTAYRIAQEALTNTMKHAPGGQVRIEIGRRGGMLTVEIGNDLCSGQPGPHQSGSGQGLVNMRARAGAVGGTLQAGPVGTGWLVRAELPVAEGYP